MEWRESGWVERIRIGEGSVYGNCDCDTEFPVKHFYGIKY